MMKKYIYIYIYTIYIYLRKVSGKGDKPDTDNGFSNNISYLFLKGKELIGIIVGSYAKFLFYT